MNRLLAAGLVTAISISGCGGKVVFVQDDDGSGNGAGGAGNGGAPSGPATNSATTSVMTSGGQVCLNVGDDCTQGCAAQNPGGLQEANALAVQFCGCSDFGDCVAACKDDTACFDGAIGQACCDCLFSLNTMSGCVPSAVFSEECQSSPACSGFTQCAIGCGSSSSGGDDGPR